MARLRCTSCDLRFDRGDAVWSDFKCPDCGGPALFDWSEEGTEPEQGGPGARNRRRLSRWLRGGRD